jgi:hypothetical protein
MKRVATALLLGTALVTASPAQASTGPPVFSVGAAARSINPPVPVYSGGFGYSPPISRVRDPLQVRAFYVSNGHHAVAFAVVDSQAYFSSYQEGPDFGITSARADAAHAIGKLAHRPSMAQGDIVVQGTHSHAAPTLEGIWGPVPPSYLRLVHDQTVAAMVAAARRARPARLQWATVSDPNIAGVNINQDSYEGWANDPQISILRAVSPRTGATVAVLANAPTHGAHICGQCDRILSADWFGSVRAELDRKLGGTSVVGPATLGREESPVETTGAANMEWLARVIANDVARGLGHARWLTDSRIASSESFVQIPAHNAALLALNDAWHLPDDQKRQMGETTGLYPIDRDDKPPYRSGNVLGTYLTALRVGGLAFVSMPGENFPEIRFAIAGATHGARAIVALSKGQDDFGYFYPAFITPAPFVYQSDHHIFNVAPQAGDQIIAGQTANVGKLGFPTDMPIAKPPAFDPGQKARPGLQALASPPSGDAGARGRFSPVLQAIYSPASFTDYPLTGKVQWDFGDGTRAQTGWLQVGQDYGQTGQGNHGVPRFRHAFRPGRYTVRATARDTQGNEASWTIRVEIFRRLCPSISARHLRGSRWRLRATAHGGARAILAWRWQLPGGAMADGPVLVRRFRGAPALRLRVTDATGTVTTVKLRRGAVSAAACGRDPDHDGDYDRPGQR